MKCRDASEMINSYFDNKIDPMKDKLLAQHIKSCPKCMAELDFLIKYRNILKAVKPVPPPDNFLTQLHRKIELEQTESPLRKFIAAANNFFDTLHFPIEAAGVLALAAVVFFLYKPFFNEKIPETTAEYGIETSRGEVSQVKDKTEIKQKSDRIDRIISLKDNPAEDKEAIPGNSILQNKRDEDSISDDNPAVIAKSEYDNAVKSEKKKSLPAEMEKSMMKREEHSYSAESMDVKGASGERKDAAEIHASEADKCLSEFKVSIIKNDLSRSSGLYYRIKVEKSKHSSLIKRLKKNFTVEEKIIKEKKSYYEIELFLKNNKK